MKKCALMDEATDVPFMRISEEIILIILDFLSDNPLDVKAFSLTCKYFREVESQQRRILRPVRLKCLSHVLCRYPHVSDVDLTFCPRVDDLSLIIISESCKGSLKQLDLSRSWFFTGFGLNSLADRCENLTSLNLSNSPTVRDCTLAAVGRIKNLENLWLNGCSKITDMGVGCVAVGCSKLRLVHLKHAFNVTDLSVGLIAMKCKELRSMDLSHLPITNEALLSVLKLQHLEELILQGCSKIDESLLPEEKHIQKSLKKLNISCCSNITYRGLSLLTNGADSIQQLIFSSGPQVNAPLVRAMNPFHSLQSLILDGSVLTDLAWNLIANCTVSLHELSLRECDGVSDEALSFVLPKHKDLRKIDIKRCREITSCGEITSLSISMIATYCTKINCLKMESCTFLTPQDFLMLGQCVFLEELDLTDNLIGDHGLKSVATCVNLRILKLGFCRNINDEGISAIGGNCANLVEIELHHCCGITDWSMWVIGNGCRELEAVKISYCSKLTDGSLTSLSKLSKLRTLECSGCKLMTSNGVYAVAAGCQQLRTLDIKRCKKIGDNAMIMLAKLSRCLRKINVSFTSVTDDGMLALTAVSCLQKVTAVHVNGLTEEGIMAALLACGGLRKAKLHSSMSISIDSQNLLLARGCVLKWSDKKF